MGTVAASTERAADVCLCLTQTAHYQRRIRTSDGHLGRCLWAHCPARHDRALESSLLTDGCELGGMPGAPVALR
jgi:hypothetical protein